MLLTEYDEEQHIRNEKQISFEDGVEYGLEKGIEKGIEKGKKEKALQVYNTCKERGMTEEDAIAISGYLH